jgi:hypothetical protein
MPVTKSNVHVGLLLGAALVLAGCAQPGAGAGTSASGFSGVHSAGVSATSPGVSASASDTVTLTGIARMYGGPATSAGSMALDGDPGEGITVAALQDGRAVASMQTGADDRFTLAVPPGTYLLTGWVEVTVVVGPAPKTTHDIECPVP